MAITLTNTFLAELKKAQNTPNCVLELILDNQTLYWGYHNVFNKVEVQPILKNISSLQNKIDPEKGYTTRGQITFTITGRDNFKNLIKNNYLKNRRVNRKEGFVREPTQASLYGSGIYGAGFYGGDAFPYDSYITTFTGKITDWQRKGDELTITVADELAVDSSKNLPVENDTKTQYLDFRNTHPVDIMTTLLTSTAALNISTSYINSTAFTTERNLWLQSWVFDRVITEPEPANQYLNELQLETNSFIIHEGDKISFKVFAPAVPTQIIEKYNDNDHLLIDSLSVNSGYKDNFYNRVCIYYDYDESNDDNDINYESLHIATDAASQSTSQWSEIKTKTIKSKWFRSRTYTQPANITGCKIYHCSYNNVIIAGSTLAQAGTLTYTFNSTADMTLSWKPPSSSAAGTAVSITKNGKFQLFGIDTTKSIKVLITSSSLPITSQSDNISVTNLNSNTLVGQLAQKVLNRYRNPISEVKFALDINNIAWDAQIVKPTDLKDLTTDESFEFGNSSWLEERLMITSIKPDFEKHRIEVEAIETKLYKRYGFITPVGYPDYPTATPSQREYAFIGNSSNQVGSSAEDGYYIY